MQSDTLFYMCNFDDHPNTSENEAVKKLWSNKWPIEDTEFLAKLLATELETDLLIAKLKTHQDDSEIMKKVLRMSISTFLTFCDRNWSTHPEQLDLTEYLGQEWPKIDVNLKLERDSEPILVNILYPELLYLSSQLFGALYAVEQSLIHLWWYFRSKVVHQRAMEDSSASLYSELEMLIAKLCNEMLTLTTSPRVQILMCLEIGQAYLLYGRIQGTEEYLIKARELAGLKLELTGGNVSEESDDGPQRLEDTFTIHLFLEETNSFVKYYFFKLLVFALGILGKRTKFQQTILPQLALSSELAADMDRPSAEESHGSTELPPDIELNDDVRLNKIQYEEKISQAELPSLEQTLCLLTVQYLQKAQPKDDLMIEELQPYIELILTQKRGAWSVRVAALLVRCKLESTHKRTVERAMLQCESIVNDKTITSNTTRLSYLWASGLQPSWTWRQQLADLYLSLGLVKAALEEYQTLHLWEDVIVCYTLLQLRHKAAEVIQQQIDIEPSVKLYCLLGDATDEVKYYEKAWEFSNCKSSRAQRHWGNFLYDHKKYEECIPHYEKSVEINSIQEGVWLRLGYAALVTEQWETSARAYRRYTYLQPNSFEAWNNLAKVYLNQRDKNRAYRALLEALRFNYDNWKLWENVIMVSMDTGHFEDVLRGIHRLLDILHKYEDVEVLSLIVRAVVQDIQDADGNGAARLQKRVLELFGRITSIHQNKPELWQLYSDVSPTYLLRAQRLLKAYRGYTQNGNWPHNPESCKQVIDLAQSVLEYSLKARQDCEDKDTLQANSQLSSARLTGQAVIRASEKQGWPENSEALEALKVLFSSVTEYIKSVM